jgi:tetratricopeptide (TPR) repeat protein
VPPTGWSPANPATSYVSRTANWTCTASNGWSPRKLLAHRIGPDRVAAEPAAIADIIQRCAHLPLALSIVAACAATHPRFPLATLADELRDNLDALGSIRSVFSYSYQALTAQAACLFRLLGLHPGPDISIAAAASLTGTTTKQARLALTELADANLITEHVPHRYTMHDLLRCYARETAHACDSEEVRQRAVRQMLDHYLHTAYVADRLLDPPRSLTRAPFAPPASDVQPEQMATDQEAMAWFSVEHQVLLAALGQAADAGMDTHAWQLAWSLDTFLYRGGHWPDQIDAWQIALTAAERLRDLAAQATAHRNIGRANTRLGHFCDAHTHLSRALDLETQAGNELGQADTHCVLSYLAERQGQVKEALRHNEQALSRYQATGHRVGEANTLHGIGWQHALLGDYHRALVYCGRALPIRPLPPGRRAHPPRRCLPRGRRHRRCSCRLAASPGHPRGAGPPRRRAGPRQTRTRRVMTRSARPPVRAGRVRRPAAAG